MDNPQIIALVAIAISVISIGLVVADVFNLQTVLMNLNTNLIEQSQTIKSLNQQQNASQQIIEEQQSDIMKMQNNISNLTNKVNSLEDRVTSLERRLPQNCLTSGSCPPPPIQEPSAFVQGKIDQALSFDGVGDVVTIPNSPTLNFGSTGSFSISLWMKSTQSGTGNAGFGWLVDHRRNNDGVYQGYTIGDRAGIIDARIRDGSAHDVVVSSTTNVNDGNFHHVVFVVDRSSQTESLYIDNVLQNSTSISTVGSIDTAFDLHFGGTASPDTPINFFNGIMDQVRIYDRMLSLSEIHSLFNETSSSSVPTNELVGEWKFDGNTLNTVR